MALSKDFIDAVEEGNVLRVKLMLKNSLLIDPTCQSFDQMFSFANERIANLIDKHDGETLKSSEEWDEEYYNVQTVKIVNNFSRERIDLLKSMAKKLYAKKSEDSSKVGNGDRRIRIESNYSQKQSTKPGSGLSSQKMIGVGAAAVGAGMLIGGLIVADAPIVIPIIGGVALAAGIGVIILDKK